MIYNTGLVDIAVPREVVADPVTPLSLGRTEYCACLYGWPLLAPRTSIWWEIRPVSADQPLQLPFSFSSWMLKQIRLHVDLTQFRQTTA